MATLVAENQRLREQLELAEETLRAIREGEVDALVMSANDGERIFTLAGNDASYRALIEAMSEGAFVLTQSGLVFYANRRLGEMLKTEPQALVGENFADWVAASDRVWFQSLLSGQDDQFKRGTEILLIASDGAQVPSHLSVNRLPGEGEQAYFSLVATDLTEHKAHEARILTAERLARSILEQAAEAIVVCDQGTQIVRVNRLARHLCGSNPLGHLFCDAFTLRLPDGSVFSLGSHRRAGRLRTLDAAATRQGGMRERNPFEAELNTENGRYSLLVTIGPWLGAQGDTLGTIVTLTDISQRKAAEEEIFQLAFHDSLTQLPNRRLLQDHLRQTLIDCVRRGRRGALVFIDLDNFKTLNDTLGHDYGDKLLQMVARRLTDTVREGDRIARLGGDEFVLILRDLSWPYGEAARQAETVCKKIHDALKAPYQLAGHEHHVTPSIGITLFGDQDATLDDLLKQADLAMYQAKASGRDTLRFFDPAMQQALEMRSQMESRLRDALRSREFRLDFQPQIDRAGRVIGAEALLRWPDPTQGFIPPATFIPLAEDTGLILPLGQWVLEAACAQLASWARDPATAHLTISVNVSARQFRQPNFVEQIRDVLQRFDTIPSRLQLELTESLLLKDIADTRAKMAELKEHGIGFSLDDFGTGYSSLAYLKRLPLDELKIDQSFVRDLLADPSDAAIVDAILALARSLGLRVLAEGVETRGQHNFLLDHGCDCFQGYLFGHPGPADSIQPHP